MSDKHRIYRIRSEELKDNFSFIDVDFDTLKYSF